jgi:tetratricopeptide (TPR) repeat protein
MQAQILMPLDQSISSGHFENASGRGFDTVFTYDKFREVLTLRLNPLRKKAIHRKVARAIETQYAGHPTRLQPYFSRLAHHHLIAENIPEAIDYFLKAAQHAVSVYAFIDAADLMEQALALLTDEEKQLSRVTILQQLADAYLYTGQPDKAIEAGKAACLLWHNLGNPVKEAEASLIIAFSFHWQGRELNALNYIHHALTCLEAHPEERHLLAKAYAQWGMAATIMGDTVRAGECLQRADDLHTQLEKQDSFISVVLFWGWCWHAFLTGTPQQMLTHALHGTEVCRATHRPGWEPMLSCSAACALTLLGRIAEGEEMAHDALEKAQRYNAVGAQGWANLFLAFLAVQQRRWDQAEYYSNTALSIAQTLQDADLQARVFWSRSLAAGKQGYKELAISHAMEALHIMQQENETSMVYPHLLLQAATSYFYAEQMENAQTYLDHAMQLAHNRQYRQLSALGQRLQGQILSIQGKRYEAQFCFEQSLATLAELHDTVEYARTQKAYTQLPGVR